MRSLTLDDLKQEALGGVPTVTKHMTVIALLRAAEALLSHAQATQPDEASFVYNYRLVNYLLRVSQHPNLSAEQLQTIKQWMADSTAQLEALKPRIVAERTRTNDAAAASSAASIATSASAPSTGPGTFAGYDASPQLTQ